LFSLYPLIGCGISGPHEPTISCQALLAACNPAQRDAIERDLRIIKETAANATSATRSGATDTSWLLWCTFCRDLHIDPFLSQLEDPIPLLQIFAHRYRTGTVAPSGSSVRSRTVEGALRAVGQTFATLGSPDPRLQNSGKLDFRLSRQLTAYAKQDPPPSRVKPIPFPLIATTAHLHYHANTPHASTLADMLLLGFFFLLRPGEYAHTSNPDASPFRLCDTHLFINNRRLHPDRCTVPDLRRVNYIGLEFTTQKNGVRGEIVGLGLTGHPLWCPVRALINRVTHLVSHKAPLTTPLYSYHSDTWRYIDTTMLTAALRTTVYATGANWGLQPTDISIRSLRSSGAMALLCAKVDTDLIRLLGRWRSDEMLRYLHVQSFPIVAPLAAQMLQHGTFTLIPNQPFMG
jgi:hypothetical protein